MAVLRTGEPVQRSVLLETLPLPEADMEQRVRCLDSLLRDGLAAEDKELVALPGVI